MNRFPEEEITRSEINEELRYAASTGAVLPGFFFVSIHKLISRDAVAAGLVEARKGKEEYGVKRSRRRSLSWARGRLRRSPRGLWTVWCHSLAVESKRTM
jgi:hypothetical protein